MGFKKKFNGILKPMKAAFHAIKMSFGRKLVRTKYFSEQHVLKRRGTQGTLWPCFRDSPA